jgi:hypothetical protein
MAPTSHRVDRTKSRIAVRRKADEQQDFARFPQRYPSTNPVAYRWPEITRE